MDYWWVVILVAIAAVPVVVRAWRGVNTHTDSDEELGDGQIAEQAASAVNGGGAAVVRGGEVATAATTEPERSDNPAKATQEITRGEEIRDDERLWRRLLAGKQHAEHNDQGEVVASRGAFHDAEQEVSVTVDRSSRAKEVTRDTSENGVALLLAATVRQHTMPRKRNNKVVEPPHRILVRYDPLRENEHHAVICFEEGRVSSGVFRRLRTALAQMSEWDDEPADYPEEFR